MWRESRYVFSWIQIVAQSEKFFVITLGLEPTTDLIGGCGGGQHTPWYKPVNIVFCLLVQYY